MTTTITQLTWTRTAPNGKNGGAGGKIVSDCGRFTICQEQDAWRGWYLWDDVKAERASDNYGVVTHQQNLTTCKNKAQRVMNGQTI